VGAHGIQRLEAGEGDDDDAVHPQRVTRRTVGVNATIPTFHASETTGPTD